MQTRTGSTRLPAKALLPLGGKPLFVRLVERVRQAALSGDVVVATTYDEADNIIEHLCLKESIPCFRGHPQDLLDRHYQAAAWYGADVVVKIPSDCPIIDVRIIDRVLAFFVYHTGQFDYVSNLHPATYPDGNDVEVFTMEALMTAWKNAGKDFEREHTTPYFWENPEHFRIGNVFWETGLDYSMSHRWVLDYEEDYKVIQTLYDALSEDDPFFGIKAILSFLDQNPLISELNAKYAGVNWYRHHIEALRTIKPAQTKLLGAT
ncbi:MAG TPA: glycosyltransferase family protein [Dissulfurispiraceae bacterium]|nr:glycosyltransferase family protein [Dissulfurispiraceae bacterium]